MFRHRFNQVWLDPASGLYVKDSSFKIVRGLDGKGISFESVNYPGHFLRRNRKNWNLDLNSNDQSSLFKKDASFMVRKALDDKAGAVSFESINYPGYYIAHLGFRVFIRKFQNTALYKHDASWSPIGTTKGDDVKQNMDEEEFVDRAKIEQPHDDVKDVEEDENVANIWISFNL